MLIYIDFDWDLNWLTVQALTRFDHGFDPAHDAFTRFSNLHELEDRLIHQQPYKVFVAPELTQHQRYPRLKHVIAEIKTRLRTGQSITPYLSARTPKLGKKGRDYLLQHWRIHHLHLSPISTLDKKGLVKRADDLLFLKVDEDRVYLLTILPHKEDDVFEQVHLLEVVEKNWPRLHGHVRGQGLSREIQPKERHALRRNHINTFESINGRVIMAGTAGVSTAGSSIEALRAYDHLNEQLRWLEAEIRQNLWKYFPRSSGRGIAHVRLEGLSEQGFDIVEVFTSQRVRVHLE